MKWNIVIKWSQMEVGLLEWSSWSRRDRSHRTICYYALKNLIDRCGQLKLCSQPIIVQNTQVQVTTARC